MHILRQESKTNSFKGLTKGTKKGPGLQRDCDTAPGKDLFHRLNWTFRMSLTRCLTGVCAGPCTKLQEFNHWSEPVLKIKIRGEINILFELVLRIRLIVQWGNSIFFFNKGLERRIMEKKIDWVKPADETNLFRILHGRPWGMPEVLIKLCEWEAK